MKLILNALISLFFISCSSPPDPSNKADLAEKNKETAIRNEVTRVIELAQKVEKEGRSLDPYRNSSLPVNKNLCLKLVAEKMPQLEDFKTRVEKLPDRYREKLLPLFDDFDHCLACEKKAVESCKKARAGINQAISEIYP